ncbi:MAG TPA: EVE domain-containing protein [Cyanobacteria bacterium UBA8803]|nr:EVE domain-containing protein [Cyanobacteria bacterium UBA9273]HBL59944.1 EVE domain-containing protein [Cyanobacteria bacterium UBA8803]
MAYWLLKTEPQDYSWTDLEQQGRTIWNGVKNPLALQHIQTMQIGDQTLIYHSGKERRVVGIAEVMTLPYPDPTLSNPKRLVVDIQAVRSLPIPVTLKQIKENGSFNGFDLIRLPRLSVVPVSAEYWQRLLQQAGEGTPEPGKGTGRGNS